MDTGLVQRMLAECAYDPNATRVYEILRGGFLWSDELPDRESDDFIPALLQMAKVIAHRSDLTLGEPKARYQAEWDALQEAVPDWPGFRDERIYGSVERDLKEVKICEERCLRDLENELRDEDS